PAAKSAGLRMPVSIFDPPIEGAVVAERVRIQYQDVFALGLAYSRVISLGETQIGTILYHPHSGEILVDEFDRAIGRSVVRDEHFEVVLVRAIEDRAQAIFQNFPVVPADD